MGPNGAKQSQTGPNGSNGQGGDLAAGIQALPVGKIIEAQVLRKGN